MNPRIEILPEHIIDQIKAGEVLERPASLIKELIENSLDAGSTDINIHLVENGLDLIVVEDNGHGMSFENLPYAFLRHATSKLKTYDDLFRLKSFGFRGEALASVAASARLTCTSQPKDLNVDGGKIIIHGGAEELLIPNRASSHGTSLYIKDLFYNTPARLKFIKSKVSEKSALKKMLYAFILSNPKTNFSIKWDDKEKEIFKSDDPLLRTEAVFFSKVSKNGESPIWTASEEYDNYKVEVFFTPTTHTTPQYRHHYLFANNRFFQDKSLHSAILRTLEPLWRYGESGHYMVKITTPAEDIDVNVHPNKTQIKFLKSDVIYSLLVTGLKSAMKKNARVLDNPGLEMKQEQFFTREENQTFDLLNMTNSEQVSELPIFQPQSEALHQSSIIGFIDTSILLLNRENKFFVADVKKVMADYLTSSLLDFKNKEETAGPLLISEPFKISRGKIDSHLEDLKNLGFELDRLNPEVIALRTLPRFVPQALSRDITNCLIQYFESSKTKNFEHQDFYNYVETNWTTSASVPGHLLSMIVEQIPLSESKILVQLCEKNLKGLLK